MWLWNLQKPQPIIRHRSIRIVLVSSVIIYLCRLQPAFSTKSVPKIYSVVRYFHMEYGICTIIKSSALSVYRYFVEF